ncbi:MAG: histidinol-phosphate transaminase [Clostridiaceae bacterium]|nr:histidinol-phosphate transaminase [Clostridiaceae bacterium]
MSRFWSDITREITPYVPGEQPRDMIRIKLNTNENPYPPSPGVIEYIREMANSDLRLYPDPDSKALCETVAKFYGLSPSLVFPGNGSDEILAFVFQAFFGPNDLIAFPDVTYSFYPVYAGLYRIPYREVPVREDFSIEFSDYPKGLKGIIFANPNAPTGIYVPPEEIELLLRSRPDTLVVMDEAYVDFGNESAVPLVNRYDNLLLVHTLSKSRSIAGMRVGLAMGHPELIEGLNRIKNCFNSYTMDRLAQAAAIRAFEDDDYYRGINRKIITERERFKETLRKMGIPCTDSKSNFAFLTLPGIKGPDALRLLREQGILVRNFARHPRIADWLRITIGTKEDMDRVVVAIIKIMERQRPAMI